MEKRVFIKSTLLAAGALLLARKSMALAYYPTAKKAEWTILYPDLSGYRRLIVGGSIRSGVTPVELQEYLISHKAMLSNKIRGYFAVCGNMRQPITEEQSLQYFNHHLMKLTGVEGITQHVFPGRITFGLMEPHVREQMKAMPGMEEYDNLKRNECMAFGREILTKMNKR